LELAKDDLAASRKKMLEKLDSEITKKIGLEESK
jgi:hypothetical protein